MMKRRHNPNSIVLVIGLLSIVWIAGCSVKPTIHRPLTQTEVSAPFDNRLGWYLLDGHDEELGALLYCYLLLPSRPLAQSEYDGLALLWKSVRFKEIKQQSVQFYLPVKSRDLTEMERMESSGQWTAILNMFHAKRRDVIASRLNIIELEQPMLVLGFKPLGQLAKDMDYTGDLFLFIDYSMLLENKLEQFNKRFSKELLHRSKAISKNRSFEIIVKSLKTYFGESSDQAIRILTLTD